MYYGGSFSFGRSYSGSVLSSPEGGLIRLYVNDTGGVSVKGTVVQLSSAIDLAVKKVIVDVPNPIGVIYNSGVPQGGKVWVVFTGSAYVLFNTAVTRNWLVRTFIGSDSGYIEGYGLAEPFPSSPFATDKHFCEFGHSEESTVTPGLCRVNLHMN